MVVTCVVVDGVVVPEILDGGLVLVVDLLEVVDAIEVVEPVVDDVLDVEAVSWAVKPKYALGQSVLVKEPLVFSSNV